MNRKTQDTHSYKHYFFWHYVIRFLFIGILTAAMLIPSYYIMIHSMKQKEIQSLSSNMEERFQKLNSTLNMLAGQARLASNQISVLQIGMAKELSEENGKDQYELSMARKWFQSSITPDELLTNAYMLSKNNRAFVSGNLVTTNEKEIYGTFYEVEGYSMEAWRESILRACKNYAFLPSAMTNSTFSPNMLGAKEPIIHMIVPISDYGIKSNQVMVYMLNTRRLFQDISPLQDGGLLCLRDKENNILAVRTEEGAILNGWNQTEEGEPDRENQESWIRIQSTNEITGLSADCYVPQEYFNELLRPAQRMTVFMAVGILLLVAILSFFMAARHSTSESRTMRMIEKIYPEIMDNATAGKRRKKVFGDYVLGTIRMLDEKQKNYNERFQTMKNALEETLLVKIIHGEAQSEREIENCREVLDIKYDYFIGAYLNIVVGGGGKIKYKESDSNQPKGASLEEQRMIGQMVLDLVHHYLISNAAVPCLCHEEERDCVFILCLSESSASEREKVQKCLRKAVSYVESHVDVLISMGIGSLVQGIPKAAQSVKEAKREADQEKKRLILGRGEEQKKKGILFSSKSMRRLSMLLTSGERKETEAFFHELEQMMGETELSDDEGKQIFYGVRGILDGILKGEGKGDVLLPGFNEKRDTLEQLRNLQDVAVEICDQMRKKQEKVITQKKHDVIAFIRQNFSDSNLCAAMVADRFGITEKYVFQIVRDCTGKSLGDLIKEIRFSEAEKLLQESVDINKIPERIGFNSLNTFYKAFKRNYGISPGQWRELSREGQIKGSAGGLTP